MYKFLENEERTKPLKIAFDVDGTLIYKCGELEDTPRYDIIRLFHFFKDNGEDVYIWSGGGLDYAEEWASRLGLEATVVEKGCFKPDIAVDDINVDLGIINLRV